MSIRFAAARRGESAALARALTPPRLREAGNDNSLHFTRDTLMQAALRHFAVYGLGAADRARLNAEEAFFAGQRTEYQRWLEICRTLDRRMAASVAARRGA